MIYAIIAAGGIGSRMGKDLPKQYLTVGAKPIIAHTVQKFLDISDFKSVIVLCPEEWCAYTQELLDKYCDRKAVVLKGGITRNETVMNAVNFIEETDGLDETTVIVTHDAVRPFVTEEIIRENIEKSAKFEAIGTVIPATDTIVFSENGLTVDSTPDRSKLYQCQTPQTFRAKLLKEFYNSLTDAEKDILTDTCKIFIIKGYDVHMVRGNVQNIKITYPFDLKVAEAILNF